MAPQQFPIVLLLIGQGKRLIGSHCHEAPCAAPRIEPPGQALQLLGKPGAALGRVLARLVYRRDLRHDERPARLDVIGVARQRSAKALLRLGGAVLVAQRMAQRVMHGGDIRAQLYCPPECRDRFIAAIQLAACDAQVVARLEVRRRQLEHLAVTVARLLAPAERPCRGAQMKPGVHMTRVEPQRRAVGRDRLCQLALGLVHAPEVVVRMPVRVVEPERLRDELLGARVVRALVGDEPKEVKRVGVARVRLEDLPVSLFRLRQPSGLVMRDGLMQELDHCGAAHQRRHMPR